MTRTRFRVLDGMEVSTSSLVCSRPLRKRQRARLDELTFVPGQVRKAIDLPVVADNLAEPMFETFNGFVLGAVGAPIDTDQTTFSIFEE